MQEKVKNHFFSSIAKGSFLSVICSLVAIIIFAFVLKFTFLSTGVIKTVNQFVKVISIFIGCFVFIRGKMGLIKGVLVGGFSTVITYLIFSLMNRATAFDISFYIDLLFGVLVGAICGIISVNVKKE